MRLRYSILPVAILALGACGWAQESSAAAAGVAKIKTELKDAKGQTVGTATLRRKDSGVLIELKLKNLPPGEHAVHFHKTAKCDPPDFKSAEGHFNPENKHHGLKNPEGPHAGDMENIMVKADGTFAGKIMNSRVSLAGAAQPNSLLSNGGTALVIHAKADDMTSDPSGNAGDRIACGVITP